MIRNALLNCAVLASALVCALPAHADAVVRVTNGMDNPHVCFCIRAYGADGLKDGRYSCTSQYGQYAESAVGSATIKKLKVTAFDARACKERAYGENDNHLVSRIVPTPGKAAYVATLKTRANGSYYIKLSKP